MRPLRIIGYEELRGMDRLQCMDNAVSLRETAKSLYRSLLVVERDGLRHRRADPLSRMVAEFFDQVEDKDGRPPTMWEIEELVLDVMDVLVRRAVASEKSKRDADERARVAEESMQQGYEQASVEIHLVQQEAYRKVQAEKEKTSAGFACKQIAEKKLAISEGELKISEGELKDALKKIASLQDELLKPKKGKR